MTDQIETSNDQPNPPASDQSPSGAPFDQGAGIQISEATNHAWNSDDLRPAHWKGTYFESARNRDGTPATEIQQDTIIKIPVGPNGMEVTVLQAHRHGFLDIDSEGNFVMHSRESRDRKVAESEQTEQQAKQERLEAILPPLSKVDPDANADVDRLFSVAAEAGHNVQGVVAEYLSRGELPLEFTKAALASGMNDPHGTMERAMAGFQKVAKHVIAASDVRDPSGFVDWVQNSVPRGEVIRAEMRLFNGDPSGYQSLAERFKQFGPIDHSKHGLEVTREVGSDFVKFPDGREMSARAARIKGLI